MARFLIGTAVVLFLILCLVLADWLVNQLTDAIRVIGR